MSISKHKRTNEMIINIKTLQIEKDLSDKEVAEQAGIPLTTYKNIIRSIGSGGNDYVKDSIINKLADLYDCTVDYILGLSDDRTLNRFGEVVERISKFNNRDKLSELTDDKNKKFMNAKVIIENRKNGVQPAMFIIENGRVNMVTITPDHQFYITDEGPVGERYDEHGKWCGKNNMVRSEEEIRECISNLEKKLKQNENLFATTEDIFLKQRLLTNSFNIESQLYAFHYVLGERYEYKHL